MALTNEQLVTELYLAYFNRVPDAVGLNAWVSDLNNGVPLATVAADFANSAEAQKLYPFLALPTLPVQSTAQAFVVTVYENLLNRDPTTADPTGLAYWTKLLDTGTISPATFILDLIESVNGEATSSQDYQTLIGKVNAADAAVAALQNNTNATFTLTVGQDTFAGKGGDTFNAPLAGVFGNQPTLTALDSLTDTGPGNVLNAGFNGNFIPVGGVTIKGIQTWNLENVGTNGLVQITGGAGQLSGLTTLSYNDNGGGNSLAIGTALDPVLAGASGTFDGFTINVSNAVGDGGHFIDVSLAAAGFPTTPAGVTQTITVNAAQVGHGGDADIGHAYSVGAGSATAGFTNWVVNSTGAPAGSGFTNDLAIGADGNASATSLKITDDGSTTILFATHTSNSLVSDWANLKVVDASGTTGELTVTGAETATGAIGGGLLTDDTKALTTVLGGTGADVFDLSGYLGNVKQVAGLSISGGGNTTGTNSIVGISDVGTVVELSSTEINTISAVAASAFAEWTGVTTLLDVASGATPTVGGAINMADFPGTLSVTLASDTSGTFVTQGSNLVITNAPNDFVLNTQNLDQGDFNLSIAGVGGVGSTATVTFGIPGATGFGVFDSTGTLVSTGVDNVNLTINGAFSTEFYGTGIVAIGASGGTETLTIDSAVTLDVASHATEVLSLTTLALFGGTETTTTLPPFVTTWSETGTLDLTGAGNVTIGVTNASTIDSTGKGELIMSAPGDAIDFGSPAITGVTVTVSAEGSLLQGNLDVLRFGNDTLTDTAGGVNFFGNGGADTITLGSGATHANDVVFGEFSINGAATDLPVEILGATQPGFWGTKDGVFGNQGTSTSVDLTTITGFTVGSDNLTFNVNAWIGVNLVDGANAVAGHAITDSNASGSTLFLGTAGITLGTGIGATASGHVDLILDGINDATFANAAALAASIGTTGVGNFILGHAPPGLLGEDVLVAYFTGTAVNIADVHITGASTNTGADTITASDMVQLVGVTSLSSLGTTANAAHVVFSHV